MDSLNELLEDVENYKLLDVLRSRGLVVCAFSAEDVLSGQAPTMAESPTDEALDEATEWLESHAEIIEDAMTEAGNNAIGMAHDPISFAVDRD